MSDSCDTAVSTLWINNLNVLLIVKKNVQTSSRTVCAFNLILKVGYVGISNKIRNRG